VYIITGKGQPVHNAVAENHIKLDLLENILHVKLVGLKEY